MMTKGALFILIAAFGLSAKAARLESYLVKNQGELKALENRANRSAKGSELKAWLKWQVALNAPQLGQLKVAMSSLEDLEKIQQTLIGQDQIHLTKGRVAFQMNKFDQAILEYQLVPKTSDYWFEAAEEESWSYIRLGQADRATAKLKTLLSPIFQTWVGPESFYAANYNALKVCDYVTIFENGKTFKERQTARVQSLESLAKTGQSPVLASVISRLESGEMNFLAYSKEAAQLPRFFWRDEFVRRQVDLIQQAKVASKATSAETARKALIKRFQTLAKAELSEYQTVIQKLNLIEAEVIQRLYLDESLKGQRPELTKIESDSHILTFPESKELWIDEVDSLQAKVKECPALKEAHL